ncbi:TIR domain-containing protein [Mesorhizobium sp.]|uniref:TIR domain-containing protein n=1 Tax=Mesorhizobium sp. TaxID=1871066 RepID=UPI0025F2FC22|nr:TIR domain-containing protein [Mesorhizobium sp.]
MARNHRIFISFAIEDEWARTRMVGQARNERTPFEFVDMSVKRPWDEAWKTQCRTRIKGCDGMIAMVTKNTAKADGQLWEVRAALQEGVPVLGVYATQDNRPYSLPSEFRYVQVVGWTWDNVSSFLEDL